MNLFGKSKKTDELISKIPETIENGSDKFNLALYGNGRYSSDFNLKEISYIDDHINGKSFVGNGESKDFYLPMKHFGKPSPNDKQNKFEVESIIVQDNIKEMQEGIAREKYHLNDSKLHDYHAWINGYGIIDLHLWEYTNLSINLQLSPAFFEKIHQALKEDSVSRIGFEFVFFNLYKSDSDPKNSNMYYLPAGSLKDDHFGSTGFLKNLIIESYKTKLP